MAGTLTRLQMATEVLDNLSRSSSGLTRNQVTMASRAVTWLDRSAIKIARQHDLLFAIAEAATIADQLSYAFPTDVRSVYSIRLEDGLNSRKLTCMMPREFDLYVPKPEELSSNVASIYIPYKTTNTFELYPVPDDDYTMLIRYSFWPAALLTDAATSDYSYMDDVLIYYATSEGYKWLQEMKDADFWQKRGDEALLAAINAEKSAFPDWAPYSQGFSTAHAYYGEFYSDPFVLSNPGEF